MSNEDNTESRGSGAGEPVATRPSMPGYGIPAGSEGMKSWAWADERLGMSHNYWLATTRPDGRPHLMVIWGIWLDGVFYFSSGRESRKSRNLSTNAQCVIGTEKADEAVVLEGLAEEVADIELRRTFLRLYERKYDFDMSTMAADILSLKEPIFAVRPKVAFGLDEQSFQQSATRWLFDS